MSPSTIVIFLALSSSFACGKTPNELREVQRQRCYDVCPQVWSPGCFHNPDVIPNNGGHMWHGNGRAIYPNKCIANCFAKFARYAVWSNQVFVKKIQLPSICLKHKTDIYFLKPDWKPVDEKLFDMCTKC